jgi:hypothetical protein
MVARRPFDPAKRERLEAACLAVAKRLDIDPEDVAHDGTHVCLTVHQVYALMDRPAGS